jgi:hypothetical protein
VERGDPLRRPGLVVGIEGSESDEPFSHSVDDATRAVSEARAEPASPDRIAYQVLSQVRLSVGLKLVKTHEESYKAWARFVVSRCLIP